MIKLQGFAPDVDPYTAGVITDCDNMTPTVKGFRSSPDPVATDYPALAAECQGAAIRLKLDGSYRLFAGTGTDLYEGANGVWTSITRLSGSYNVSIDDRWQFAQFGDVTLATNKADVIQEINAAANFADISGAPKARHIETVSGFVMIADTDDTTYGEQSDRWWCSALYDHTDWTPSISTQCTTGRLVDAPGGITGLKRLGKDIVAYKERSIFLGRYIGSPLVWSWQQIPGEAGVLSPECIVGIGSAHLFIGYDDIYYFDGTRPVPVGNAVKDWFFADMDKSYRYKIIGAHDRLNSSVYWFYPSSDSDGALDSCLIYNYKSKQWGKATYSVEVAAETLTGQVTYDSLGNVFATYDDLPEISYDSPFWQTAAPVISVFNTSHELKTLTGSGSSMSITTSIMGDDDAFSLLRRVRPRFATAPTSATMTNYYDDVSGENMTQDTITTMVDGKFDVLRSSRWHKLTFDFTGETIITGFTADNVPSGDE
jgi:hypothetical protein